MSLYSNIQIDNQQLIVGAESYGLRLNLRPIIIHQSIQLSMRLANMLISNIYMQQSKVLLSHMVDCRPSPQSLSTLRNYSCLLTVFQDNTLNLHSANLNQMVSLKDVDFSFIVKGDYDYWVKMFPIKTQTARLGNNVS